MGRGVAKAKCLGLCPLPGRDAHGALGAHPPRGEVQDEPGGTSLFPNSRHRLLSATLLRSLTQEHPCGTGSAILFCSPCCGEGGVGPMLTGDRRWSQQDAAPQTLIWGGLWWWAPIPHAQFGLHHLRKRGENRDGRKGAVLVSAGIELICCLVAGTVLCFGFSVRMMLITR